MSKSKLKSLLDYLKKRRFEASVSGSRVKIHCPTQCALGDLESMLQREYGFRRENIAIEDLPRVPFGSRFKYPTLVTATIPD